MKRVAQPAGGEGRQQEQPVHTLPPASVLFPWVLWALIAAVSFLTQFLIQNFLFLLLFYFREVDFFLNHEVCDKYKICFQKGVRMFLYFLISLELHKLYECLSINYLEF